MSDISDDARVQMFIADYAIGDASNKTNALGVGFQYSVAQPNGFIPPMTVVVLVDIAPGHVGDDFSFELGLFDDTDQLVISPGLMVEDATAIRFAQHFTVEQPLVQIPGLRFPRDALWSRHTVVATFQAGLPLAVGRGYEWRVSIDMTTRQDWNLAFYVPGPSGGIVVG